MDIFFEEEFRNDYGRRVRVLIIYDITENSTRVKLARYLQGFGKRIQKSAFEVYVKEAVLRKLLAGLERFASKEDSIKVYRLSENCRVITYGVKSEMVQEELIIL